MCAAPGANAPSNALARGDQPLLQSRRLEHLEVDVEREQPVNELVERMGAALEQAAVGVDHFEQAIGGWDAPGHHFVRRMQHDMARKANLVSHSYGKEPRRRVRIFRD